MSSGFVSGGTIDNPTERDDEWRRAQAELEEKRRQKEAEEQQNDGKSLFDVLQANKAAKQEAFEEAARLKNQYRALDDDEAEFLDSVLEGTRKKEEEVKKETLEQLDAFRRRQEEAERRAFEEEQRKEGKEGEGLTHAQWVAAGRKRKKGHELLKGVKIRRKSGAGEDESSSVRIPEGTQDGKLKEVGKTPLNAAHNAVSAPKDGPAKLASSAAKAGPVKLASASPPFKPAVPVSLALGYASSDDEE
ncbi:hypothetical protein K458DRAFT_362592 [Lentithecium fluviatile CBS 122367]|uniref:FAM192A/Fyv6 N-terminal domain-containing protein n=1 Tax=Lentithecium fluviatile CBS 122367 TaxID=1168545 RepID=A0A6G1J8F7_9PLEO|nr:hypothetical protein K458DRAFT_362592 [Lentithecium fluviatile CBS 122367]